MGSGGLVWWFSVIRSGDFRWSEDLWVTIG
jgi:hypothetical protein